jgi:hypothetical protein
MGNAGERTERVSLYCTVCQYRIEDGEERRQSIDHPDRWAHKRCAAWPWFGGVVEIREEAR